MDLLGGDGLDLVHHLFGCLDFTVNEFLAADPGGDAATVFQSHQQPPFAEFLGAAKLIFRNSFVTEFAELGDDRLDCFIDAGEIGAGIDDRLSDIFIWAEIAVDGVDETAFFANLLEEPGAHAR